MDAVLSVDIGTASSKGVLVDSAGSILASAVVGHDVDRPAPGQVEMDADVWWNDFTQLTQSLRAQCAADITAVGVSGMGPCVLLTDGHDAPLRPAILYGVDTRATAQITALSQRYGDESIRALGGSSLSSQSAGAKIAWVRDEEPETFARARRLFMPSSWLVLGLTGEYVLDHHSASQCSPLYDIEGNAWYQPWVDEICPDLELPPLRWANEIAGTVTVHAAALTGIRAGTPVIVGTIDAWAEAVSVNALNPGDLMIMYGTTHFLINTISGEASSPSLWGTAGVSKGTRCLAGGLATSGAVTAWLKNLFGDVDYPQLVALAEQSAPGANGLVALPYFAGERTPLLDPDARGAVLGLTLSHGRGDLYRAVLEGVAFGVRHNIEAIEDAGGEVRRIVAVGGGTQGRLWTQIVSDVTQRSQVIPRVTVGASFGGAFLAADATVGASIDDWNPMQETVQPQPANTQLYDRLYPVYRGLYTSTREFAHTLAAVQNAAHSDER